MAFRRIEKRIENVNIFQYVKNSNKKDRIIYRQKCHNKRIKNTGDRVNKPYLVLTESGKIYMVYKEFYVYKGHIKNTTHDSQFYSFLKEYELYSQGKDGTSEI